MSGYITLYKRKSLIISYDDLCKIQFLVFCFRYGRMSDIYSSDEELSLNVQMNKQTSNGSKTKKSSDEPSTNENGHSNGTSVNHLSLNGNTNHLSDDETNELQIAVNSFQNGIDADIPSMVPSNNMVSDSSDGVSSRPLSEHIPVSVCPCYVVSVSNNNQVQGEAECWQGEKRRTKSEGDNGTSYQNLGSEEFIENDTADCSEENGTGPPNVVDQDDDMDNYLNANVDMLRFIERHRKSHLVRVYEPEMTNTELSSSSDSSDSLTDEGDSDLVSLDAEDSDVGLMFVAEGLCHHNSGSDSGEMTGSETDLNIEHQCLNPEDHHPEPYDVESRDNQLNDEQEVLEATTHLSSSSSSEDLGDFIEADIAAEDSEGTMSVEDHMSDHSTENNAPPHGNPIHFDEVAFLSDLNENQLAWHQNEIRLRSPNGESCNCDCDRWTASNATVQSEGQLHHCVSCVQNNIDNTMRQIADRGYPNARIDDTELRYGDSNISNRTFRTIANSSSNNDLGSAASANGMAPASCSSTSSYTDTWSMENPALVSYANDMCGPSSDFEDEDFCAADSNNSHERPTNLGYEPPKINMVSIFGFSGNGYLTRGNHYNLHRNILHFLAFPNQKGASLSDVL